MSRVVAGALIVVGGMAGTALRASLALWFPSAPGQWPWTTLWINLTGSLLLGILLEMLAAFDDAGWRRAVRLGVGTGFFGGFTTYSSFSVETVALLRSGEWLTGVSYAVLSVGVGIAAALVAMIAVRRLRASAGAS